MHRSSTEMVDVVVREGYCKLLCDPYAWMISLLQDVSYLNAQNQLWTTCKLMGELNDELEKTLNYELDIFCVDLGKTWQTNNKFCATAG